MTIGAILALVAVSALTSLCVTPLVRRLALALRIIDRPGPRKIHRGLMPRAGGLAVSVAWLAGIGMAVGMRGPWPLSPHLLQVVGIGALVVVFGLWDDRRNLPAWVKLLGQIAIASLVFVAGIRIDYLTNPLGGEFLFPPSLSYLVTVLWVIGMMNAVNLIDGLDGLACGIAGITALGLIASGLYLGGDTAVTVLAALAGACLGFLRYNFSPATIFLGDSGSQFLGFVFAVAALIDEQYKSATAVALLIPLTALSLPIADTALAIVRRFRKRLSIFRADRYHLHHRLLKLGLTQRQTVLFMYLVSGYLSMLSVLFVLIRERYALILLMLLAMGLMMAMQTLRFIEFKLRQQYRRRFHVNFASRK